jgi:hypothetical protein
LVAELGFFKIIILQIRVEKDNFSAFCHLVTKFGIHVSVSLEKSQFAELQVQIKSVWKNVSLGNASFENASLGKDKLESYCLENVR